MPTYEYECKECSHHFEVFQSMSDEPIKICPKCGKEVRRLIFGGVGVIFKGPGFYVTDRAAGKKPGGGKKQTDSTEAASVSSGSGAPAGSDVSADSGAAKKESDSKGGADHGKAVGSGAQKKNKPAAQTA